LAGQEYSQGRSPAGEKMTFTHRIAVFLIVAAALVLNACAPAEGSIVPTLAAPGSAQGPDSAAPIEPTPTMLSQERYYVPAYYSQFYDQIIEGSKTETGLRIYSSLSAENWQPVLQAFGEHYPWVEVDIVAIEEEDIFERYSQEVANETTTADIIISTNIAAWQALIAQGEVLTYRSAENTYVPSWARENAGIYAISSDPLLIIYDKSQVQNPPDSMLAIDTLAKVFAGDYQGKIITYPGDSSVPGLNANWFWINAKGEAGWQILSAVGNLSPTLETSAASIVQSVGTGNSKIGYFVPATAVLPRLGEYPNLGWSYIKDGQPILLYNAAITQSNANPNAAKLMLDFLLSQEGQLTLAMGGLTSFRSDVARISALHLETVAEEVGQENLIFLSFDPGLSNSQRYAAFIERWALTFKKNLAAEEEISTGP
jgi:iron(III) transport system substrate-binding protein